MITQLRLDERLIHGQVATAWSRFLDVSMIVVANDNAYNNPIEKKSLMMAAPGGKKVNICTVENAIKNLKDPRAEKIKILVLVKNPKDAIRVTEELGIEKVNVANYTRSLTSDVVKLTDSVFANPEDLEDFKKLSKTGKEVFTQMTPQSPRTELETILKKY